MLGGLARGVARGFALPTSGHAKASVPAVFLRVTAGTTEARLRLRVNEHLNPEAAAHFLALCSAESGGYRGLRFVNNLPGFYLETEERDVGEYLDESYPAAFNAPGMVGLSKAPGDHHGVSNGGFFVTLQRLPDLGRFVWVAQVVEGLEQLRALDSSAAPLIADCGLDGQAAVGAASSS